MSNDSPSASKSLNQCSVVSKYFASKPGMDESSDFQEKKKSCTGPKKTQNPTGSKSKKGPKRIRGQKDIRSVLKSKKNELIAYSNDFDKICKQSGIDVDSEQLQLAVALSKSLADTDKKSEEDLQASGSSQDRTRNIRKTLQEYGFVVPEIKITKGKRAKKYRKNYKLLLTTDSEKEQIISDKYAQVLSQNLDNIRVRTSSEALDNSSNQLYHIVTNISYDQIRVDNIFYVENLLEQSPNSVGSLLRDWSEIPGRPQSPVLETKVLSFDKVSCSQEELNIVLSGSLKSTQKIVEEKYYLLLEEEKIIDSLIMQPDKNVDSKEISYSSKERSDGKTKMDIVIIEPKSPNMCTKTSMNNVSNKENSIEVIDVDQTDLLKISHAVRSCSPDIFDDEVSSILGDNDSYKHESIAPLTPCKNTTKVVDEIMDLTECVAIPERLVNNKPHIGFLSQGSSATNRRSTDFMEITACVVGSSQPIRENIIDENIDLTQNSDNEVIVSENNNKTVGNKDLESMDLTQSSDTSEELPLVQLSNKESNLEDTIILNDDAYAGIAKQEDINFLHCPNSKIITAFSNNKVSDERNSNKESLETSIIELSPDEGTTNKQTAFDSINIEDKNEKAMDPDINFQMISSKCKSLSPIKHITPTNNMFDDDNQDILIIDNENENLQNNNTASLTQKISIPKSDDSVKKSKTESFFEEFVHQHSGDSSEETTQEVPDVTVDDDDDDANRNEGIDLTQTSESCEELDIPVDKINIPEIQYDITSLGKVDNVSIDYDEMFDDVVKSHTSISQSISTRSNVTEHNNEKDKPGTSDVLSSSQTSEIFEISDKELDYSLHKSRLDFENPRENFDFGGISVMDNLSDLPSLRKSNNVDNRTLNRSLSESCLPVVNIDARKNLENCVQKRSPTKSCSSVPSSSCNTSNRNIVAKTPKMGEYLIKTDQVTPILDYNTMSTPEVNAELDRYGLKPFKRKRAIQLLTHIYNQTHPIVESCSTEDLSSPSKKFKPNTPPFTSPTKRISPKKLTNIMKTYKKSNSPRKRQEIEITEETEKENNIYDVTNETPDIRDIPCNEEDWVFQKREKAKLHSCRVPLHISFHNYVSARLRLREAILRYDPVNIDVIHKGLVDSGHRYDPKDLLRFMDKKCITVKTADNNGRNKKHF